MYRLFRPLLFRLDPETAHQFTLLALRAAGNFPFSYWFLKQLYRVPSKPVRAFGLNFRNPVGLAAGYDKDGVAIRGLAALGFGHLEIGTVTPRPQPGNPRPRVFRLVEDKGVINRMGFPGRGMEFVAKQLTGFRNKVSSNRLSGVLGVNLGKNKDTPLEEATRDYIELMRYFMFQADYLAINISSPNTVGLRRLQGRDMLEQLLAAIRKERALIPNPPSVMLRDASQSPRGKGELTPLLVKLSPDLKDEELEDAVGVILDNGMDGIIATNTTLAREGLRSKYRGESGGLSGSPLAAGSEAMLRQVVKLVKEKVPIISVGGIMNAEDAKKRLAWGASLVQIYTGLVYRGPKLVQEIVKAI